MMEIESRYFSVLESRGLLVDQPEIYSGILEELSLFIARPAPYWQQSDLERFIKNSAPLLAPGDRQQYLLAMATVSEILQSAEWRALLETQEIKSEVVDELLTEQRDEIEAAVGLLTRGEPSEETDFLQETLRRTEPKVQDLGSGFERDDNISSWRTRPRRRISRATPRINIACSRKGRWVEIFWRGGVVGQQLRWALERAQEVQVREGVDHWLVDLSEATVASQDELGWFGQWLSSASQRGISTLALVSSYHLLSRLQLTRLRRQGSLDNVLFYSQRQEAIHALEVQATS